MKNVIALILLVGFFTFGCDTPPTSEVPDADPAPSATPSPSPDPTMPPEASDPPENEVVPYCGMKTLDPELLVEKTGSGETITDIRVAANDKGFAIVWRNNKSTLPTMFRSFDWDLKPTSDVVHLGDLSLPWDGFIGGHDDYLITENKYIVDLGSRPFKYNFRRVSIDGKLGGYDKPLLEITEREPAPHVMFDGKYYRVTAMRHFDFAGSWCKTQLTSWQIGAGGDLVHDHAKCIGDEEPTNTSIRSVLPIDGDVLVAYEHHSGGSALWGSIKIVGLKGPTDWTPIPASPGKLTYISLGGVYNTPSGMKMLWMNGGERFISALDDGKITTSYAVAGVMNTSAHRVDSNSIYGQHLNKLDNTTEFLRANLMGKTMSKIDLESSPSDLFYSLDGRGGKFVVAGFSWWSGATKKPELRTISCQ